MILSTLSVGPFVDWYLLVQRQNGKDSTECRLLPMVIGSALIPLGLLPFGWTVQCKVHWVAPIIFSSLVGYGYVSVAISSWSYLVDAFGIYAASATAATVLLRNAGAAALPLAGPALVGQIRYGWAFSVLALLGFATVPVTVALMDAGGRLRALKSHKRLIEH
jgi:MFS family permease